MKAWRLILGGIVILLVAGVGIYFLLQQNKTRSSPTANNGVQGSWTWNFNDVEYTSECKQETGLTQTATISMAATVTYSSDAVFDVSAKLSGEATAIGQLHYLKNTDNYNFSLLSGNTNYFGQLKQNETRLEGTFFATVSSGNCRLNGTIVGVPRAK